MMTGDELADLAADIRQHGQQVPVVTYEGMILDGRNRDLACRQIGVAPLTVEWDGEGGSPVAYVISTNLHRRHLSPSQKAAIAAEMLPMLEEEAKERQRESGRQYGRGMSPGKVGPNLDQPIDEALDINQEPPEAFGRSYDQAAKAVGVARGYVADAKRIKHEAPDVFSKVKAGAMGLPEAKREVRQRQVSADQAAIQRVLDAAGDDDGALARARLKRAVSKGVYQAHELFRLSPEAVADVIDDGDYAAIRSLHERSKPWFEGVAAARSQGLRVISGGRKNG